jgi:hypothetical protein
MPRFRPRSYTVLEKNVLAGSMGKLSDAWKYTEKHFFNEQIQDNIQPRIQSDENKE